MDKKKFTGWSWRHAALVGLLFSASTVTAQPDYRPLYLDWIGGSGSAPNLTCQETWRSGCIPSGNSYVYWPPPADDFAFAVARATRDFIPMSGHSRVDRWGGTLRCEAASVTLAPPHTVSYWSPASPWSASVTFTQQCTYTDQWGRASPPGPVQTSYSMYGECEPGFARTGGFLTTGECYRPNGGPCVKYPENTTTGCNKTTADMYATMPPRSDLKFLFHEAQTCLSEKSCALRCRMDNCKWLEAVLPDFAGYYLRFERAWPEVVQQCDELRNQGIYRSDFLCAGLMAKYHIETDLADALTRHGCGSQADWDMVYSAAISACPTAGGDKTRPIVKLLRDRTRDTCLARRQANARPDLYIEQPLRGQTCGAL